MTAVRADRPAWRRRIAAALIVLVLPVVGACSGTPSSSRTPTSASALARPEPKPTAARLGAAGCAPSSPFDDFIVQGSSTRDDLQLWGWLMPTGPLPVRAGQEVKIVWRVTGSGDLRLTARGPDGVSRPPRWGPEPHGGSNFTKPGNEWGAGYYFGTPGCWRLTATRGTGSADVWLPVSS